MSRVPIKKPLNDSYAPLRSKLQGVRDLEPPYQHPYCANQYITATIAKISQPLILSLLF